MNVKKIGVVGAGYMGSALAFRFGLADFEIVLVDRDEQILQRAINRIQQISKAYLDERIINDHQLQKIHHNIIKTTNYDNLHDVDFVLEAVTQDLVTKKEVFKKLDKVCQTHTVFATIQLTIPCDELAIVTNKPEKVIAVEFLSPAEFLPVAEIVPGTRTSEQTVHTTENVLKKARYLPVISKKPILSGAGFLISRFITKIYSEALMLVEDGLANPQQVDFVLKYGIGPRLCIDGAFQGIDYSGLDTYSRGLKGRYERTGNPVYRAWAILDGKISKNELGFKSGKGFYDYPDPERALYERSRAFLSLLKSLGVRITKPEES